MFDLSYRQYKDLGSSESELCGPSNALSPVTAISEKENKCMLMTSTLTVTNQGAILMCHEGNRCFFKPKFISLQQI